jgi:hypothetical protein
MNVLFMRSSGWDCVWGRVGESDSGGLSDDEEVGDEQVDNDQVV